jgi:hypothetical protein
MNELAYPLKIRAHHLLCILGFRGLGYGEEFVSNMEKVVGELRSDPSLPITLVVGCDAICASCPHNKEGKCLKRANSEVDVPILDLELLNRLGLEAGSQMLAGEAWEEVKKRLAPEDLTEICGDCEWLGLGYCAQGLERLRTGS